MRTLFLCAPQKEKFKITSLFYEDEMQALFDSVTGEKPLELRNRALLEILYGSGIRLSECSNLKMSDIDLDSEVMLVHGERKQRTICADWIICT